jgi:hypothetical protein
MYKTKFEVEILAQGAHNDSIIKMIGSHNSGVKEILIADIQGYIRCRSAEYPTMYSNDYALFINDGGKYVPEVLNIIENKKPTLIIKEIVVVTPEERSQTVQPEYIGD